MRRVFAINFGQCRPKVTRFYKITILNSCVQHILRSYRVKSAAIDRAEFTMGSSLAKAVKAFSDVVNRITRDISVPVMVIVSLIVQIETDVNTVDSKSACHWG